MSSVTLDKALTSLDLCFLFFELLGNPYEEEMRHGYKQDNDEQRPPMKERAQDSCQKQLENRQETVEECPMAQGYPTVPGLSTPHTVQQASST